MEPRPNQNSPATHQLRNADLRGSVKKNPHPRVLGLVHGSQTLAPSCSSEAAATLQRPLLALLLIHRCGGGRGRYGSRSGPAPAGGGALQGQRARQSQRGGGAAGVPGSTAAER